MLYIGLLICSILLAVANNLVLHSFNNRGLRGIGDVLLFNAAVSVIWIVVLMPLHGFSPVSGMTVRWGLLYGCLTAAFLLCKMQAMSSGPVSVTSFVGCSSLLVSTAFGIVAFDESITWLQGIGVALLIAALFLTVSPKADRAERVWKFWCALFFLCSGCVGIVFKLHQSSPDAGNVDGMMLVAAVTSTLLFSAFSVFFGRKQQGTLPRLSKQAIPYLIVCGLVSCGYNRLNITLSGVLPSILFFPVFNGSVILGASLLAVFFFHEKLKRQQLAGLILGVAALMLAAGVIDGLIQ